MSRGYFWDGVSSAAIDLGVLPNGTYSHADDINEYRFIAGHGDERVVKPPFFDVTHERAFLYHSDFGFYPLPGLPATTWLGSCRAVALNERQSSSSLVAGRGNLRRSGRHARGALGRDGGEPSHLHRHGAVTEVKLVLGAVDQGNVALLAAAVHCWMSSGRPYKLSRNST